ncbi:MAG: hypothetical protein IPI73_09090 [Betaproteobacteria bacterium]|nr:hypothetical protein [Betaproteobacteria bacterium]
MAEIVPSAPALLSTTIGWPIDSDTRGRTRPMIGGRSHCERQYQPYRLAGVRRLRQSARREQR